MRKPARLAALENVRSTTTLRPCVTYSSVSGKSGPRANWMYASSKTTMVRSGRRDMKCATSSFVTIVAVGLFGLAMKTILVIGVIARAIASRSKRWSFSITMTRMPPAACTIIG